MTGILYIYLLWIVYMMIQGRKKQEDDFYKTLNSNFNLTFFLYVLLVTEFFLDKYVRTNKIK